MSDYRVISNVQQGLLIKGKIYYAKERFVNDDAVDLIEISGDGYTYGLFSKNKFTKLEIKLGLIENDVFHIENGLVFECPDCNYKVYAEEVINYIKKGPNENNEDDDD